MVNKIKIKKLEHRVKHIIERSPQADMNRTVLLIPALCGALDDTIIQRALHQASHGDLESWDKKHIPYTVRRKRSEFFKDYDSQKVGKSILG